MTIIIRNLAIAGYRSFGKEPQYFDKFSKINLLIGRNNAGKSNVLRFLSEVYPDGSQPIKKSRDPLSYHLPARPPTLIGVGEEVTLINRNPRIRDDHPLIKNTDNCHLVNAAHLALGRLYLSKCEIEKTNICWAVNELNSNEKDQSWINALKKITTNDLSPLYVQLTGRQSGQRERDIEPVIIRNARPMLQPANVVVIPAIRQIGIKGSTSEEFDGNGIIERLARLQNPPVLEQPLRQKFQDITDFLRNVTENPEATIEVPYERDTINVHMDGKALPLESLGSGIHEVIILAVAATVLSDHVVCIEEPELHLNPVLQRKLMRYLAEHTSNQYFITTHSAALMDTPDAEIYHIKLQDGASVVERATSDRQRSNICEDLGYHPSDLLQANCIIWVEGPSDRIYLNYWIAAINSELIEGIHYSIMFYGGRLASHLSNRDIDEEVEDFILLRRLNRRGMIVIDSDRSKKGARINATKTRLQAEFDQSPGHAWITDGREIENYIPPVQLTAAINSEIPYAQVMSSMSKYDNCLKIKGKKGSETQASKIDIARYVTKNYQPDFSILDLKKQVDKIIRFVIDSNPKFTPK